jgi:putative Ca2+/H+ antiporter (TMEM165/GDT1 family)
MGVSNQLLLALAITNTFAGCMSLLVVLVEGYSPTKMATSVAFLILGLIFIKDYYERTQQSDSSKSAT